MHADKLLSLVFITINALHTTHKSKIALITQENNSDQKKRHKEMNNFQLQYMGSSLTRVQVLYKD